MENIFFREFETKNGLVPFDKVTIDQYEPAIKQGIKEQIDEMNAICNNPESPTFENTILALERSGKTLSRVLSVFYPMLSACVDEKMMDVANRMSPVLSEHSNNITLNQSLWQRIKTVKESCDITKLDVEDARLLQITYDSFTRAGAALEGDNREKYREISKKLTELSLKFEQNLLKATNAYKLWLTQDDVEGLPESALEAAELAAKENGSEKQYLFTLHAPSYMAFMKYSSRRELRKTLYHAYNSRCMDGELSNIEIIKDIANARLTLANLMGYKSFADYRLVKSMAQTPQNVIGMLTRLKEAYRPAEQAELEQLKAFASQTEGKEVDIMPWDYAYYSNKEREAKFDYNDEQLRPYFELNNVINGVLGLATRLYGIHFTENKEATVFDKEVKVYDVTDNEGQTVGFLYTDFFPRSTKQGGAWMTNFREQYVNAQGTDVRPIVTLTMNFTRPTETKPSLLTFREVQTFLHEFGHGLHSLLSRCKYESTSGTNVYRDFVEMPSQFNENFLFEREFLDSFAKHYETGESIPQELIDKLLASSQYGAGYACMRQLGFGFLDMAWYSIKTPFTGETTAFEHKAIDTVKVFEPVDGCLISPQFSHIFAGGYAAGYYGYKWAEVLDADAFAKFKEDGIFNPETSKSLLDNILSRGGTEHPMELYKRFRGREPEIEALLQRDGIITKS